MATILVSACLYGCECRYKGDSCRNEEVLALGEKHTLIPVCPEQLGGLATPRNPAERQGEKVTSCAGDDVTAQYRKGAQTALYIAKSSRADCAVFKANSPSCGKGIIYDGSFTGGRIPGNGVTSELFLKAGIPVFTENELDALREFLK